jgi:hypothetical protein
MLVMLEAKNYPGNFDGAEKAAGDSVDWRETESRHWPSDSEVYWTLAYHRCIRG